MSLWTRRRQQGVLWTAAVVAGAATIVAGMSNIQAVAAPAPVVTKAAAGSAADLARPAPAGFASWRQLAAEQVKLNDAATKIQAAEKAAGGDHLGSLTADPTEHAVRVYWKGAMPAKVASLVGTLRGHTTIRVLPARYGQQELLRESQRLIRTSVPGDQITEVAPLADASGLRVSLRGSAAKATAPSSKMRLVVERGAAPARNADRYHDTPPWWGGAAFTSGLGGCTTGWGVQVGGTTQVLTAGHCLAAGDWPRTGAMGQTNNLEIGRGESINTGRDIGLINPSYLGHNAAGRIYDGAFASATEPYTSSTNDPVGGASESFKGNYVFTSGAYSGYRTFIKVTAVNLTINTGTSTNPAYMSPMVQADQIDGTNAAGNGDSGGPVGMWSSDHVHVIAMGTISAGDVSKVATCTGVPASKNRKCASRIFYAPITGALNYYGASILTN